MLVALFLLACTPTQPLVSTATAAGATTGTPAGTPIASAPLVEVVIGSATYQADDWCHPLQLEPDQVLLSGSWQVGPDAWWDTGPVPGFFGGPIVERMDGTVGWGTVDSTCEGIVARVVLARF